MPLRDKLDALFRDTGLDAFVAHSYINVSYLSRANIFTQKLIPERLALILWPTDSEPTMVLCSIEEVAARRDSVIPDIRTYVEHKESPIRVLADLIRERGLETGVIGIEENALTARWYKELLAELPQAQLIGCDRALARVRMVKEDEELQNLKKAILATDAAMAAACLSARPGVSERELAGVLRDQLYREGADEISHLIFSVGDNVRDVHHLPGETRAQSGDVMHVDTGGKFGIYFSDLGRMAAVATASREHRHYYGLVWESVQQIIDATRPGLRAKDLYEVYRRHATQYGLFDERLCPHVGHGLGVELHEAPILEPQNQEELRSGMVLAVEVAYRSPDGYVYHSEDVVHLTSTGAEVLSRSRDWQQLLLAA